MLDGAWGLGLLGEAGARIAAVSMARCKLLNSSSSLSTSIPSMIP